MSMATMAAAMVIVASVAFQTSARETPAEALAKAEAMWKAQGLTNYRFGIIRVCLCPRKGETFEVVDGRAKALRKADTAAREVDESYGTIEGLFAQIRVAIETGAHRLAVKYHSKLGYPTSVEIDPRKDAFDDEVSYGVIGFKITKIR